MAIESNLSRREFIFPFARRGRSGGSQPPRRPRSETSSTPPKLPDRGRFKLTRRQVIPIIIIGGTIVAGGALTALLRPWDWFAQDGEKLAPVVTPTPEILNTRIAESAQREVLKLDNYTLNLRQKMVNFWLQGETRAVEYKSKDGQSYLFSFNPAKPDPQLKDLAKTTISLERRDLSTDGSALVFVLSGSYNPILEEGLPEQITSRLKTMNFEHEAVVSIAYINGLISVGKDLGLNFRFPSEPLPQESYLRSELNKYLPTINFLAEAVAEINDYILTYPLLDKNPQTGNILYARIPGNDDPLPIIQGRAFLESGLTFIVDSTIGLSLRQFSSWEQLSQKYPRLQDIPNYQDYLAKIEQHYKSLYQ